MTNYISTVSLETPTTYLCQSELGVDTTDSIYIHFIARKKTAKNMMSTLFWKWRRQCVIAQRDGNFAGVLSLAHMRS